MNEFRDDLLNVWFVSKDGSYALEVSRDDEGLLVRAYLAAEKGASPLRRDTAQLFDTRRATYQPPTSSTSSYAPSRLGLLTLNTASNYDNSVFLMFGGPPPPAVEGDFAWVAIRPEVPVSDVAAFPYYRGSYMDLLTGDDWMNDHDEPGHWYSPQRVYRPVLD